MSSGQKLSSISMVTSMYTVSLLLGGYRRLECPLCDVALNVSCATCIANLPIPRVTNGPVWSRSMSFAVV